MPASPQHMDDGTLLLADAWRALRDGSVVVAEGRSTDIEHLLTLEPRSTGEPPRERDLSLLEGYLRAPSAVTLAYERGIAPSQIAMATRAAAEAMGVSRATRAPVLFVWACLAAHTDSPVRVPALGNAERVQLRYPRVDSLLTDALTEKQAAVISLLIESYRIEEIAVRHGTRSRAIANHFAGASRILNLRGRLHLIQLLANKALGLPLQAQF